MGKILLPKIKWWKNWKIIAALAALIFSLSLSGLAINSIQTNEKVTDIQPIVERLDKNQAGIDELVKFVHDFQSQQSSNGSSSGSSSGGQSQVVNQIFNLLCSSSDPVRVEACKQLGLKPGG